MSTTIRTTKLSVIVSSDGYSEGYKAFVQGAFTGDFLVRAQSRLGQSIVKMEPAQALDMLRELHREQVMGISKHGITLRNARSIQ